MITDVEPDVTTLIHRNTRTFKVINTVTSSATPTFDASLADYHLMTATANVTSMTITNPTVGQIITLDILQDATGSRTFTWPTNLKGGTGVTTGTTIAAGLPTGASAVASKHTTITARYDGSNWIELARSVDAG